MKKVVFRTALAGFLFVTLLYNFALSEKNDSGDTSLIVKNIEAIADGEGDPWAVCIQPPRVICQFKTDWTPIYGEHY